MDDIWHILEFNFIYLSSLCAQMDVFNPFYPKAKEYWNEIRNGTSG